MFRLVVPPQGKVEIDLGEVTSINSVGIRGWLGWMHSLPESATVFLNRCPFVLMSQVATAPGLLSANCFIQSFSVPYYCPGCENEFTLLLRSGVEYSYGGVSSEKAQYALPGDLVCNVCQGQMEPDFIVPRIFGFLR